MFVVIKSGSKQYLVSPNKEITIEKIDGNPGEKVVFDKVLMYSDGNNQKIGKPFLDNIKVEGQIIKQKRDKKKIVFKYHSKTRYKKKKGHRQFLTDVRITSIITK